METVAYTIPFSAKSVCRVAGAIAALALLSGACAAAPIHDAVMNGAVAHVRAMLAASPDLVYSKTKDGDTPLHFAALKGYKVLVALLLEDRSDVDARDKDGDTPLYLASTRGNVAAADLLIQYGADVNAQAHDGTTPLQEAIAGGHRDMADFLRRHGAREPAPPEAPAPPPPPPPASTEPIPAPPPVAPADSLIPASELLIEDGAETDYTGTITVSAPDNPRSVNYAVDVAYVGVLGVPKGFDVFLPGITFKFLGACCIPAKSTVCDAQDRVAVTPAPGNRLVLQDGRLVSMGPLSIKGYVAINLPPAVNVVEFSSSASDPLVFKLTRQGMSYLSGTGTVRIPSGKVFTFGAAQ